MVMTSKDTRKLLNITKRVLTEAKAPSFPETLAGSMNKQYGTGLKQKYSEDELIKMMFEAYVKFMITIGYTEQKAKIQAKKVISYDEDFVPDVLGELK